MRVTVIHNPIAGDGSVTADDLCSGLRAAGHEVVYATTETAEWKRSLQDPGDAVVAAGGDGTVAKVARRLVHRAVPLLVLPTGTANNFAVTLGVPSDWRALLGGLGRARHQDLDVGVAVGPWGERFFLEGCSFGLFADAMAVSETAPNPHAGDPPRELRYDLERIRGLLDQSHARRCSVIADDEHFEADALLVAVMNCRSVGPRFLLAPDADPWDDRLHLVIALESHRPRIERYLDRAIAGEDCPLPLDVRVVRKARVRWPMPLAHVDDKLWNGRAGAVEGAFSMIPGVLRVVVP